MDKVLKFLKGKKTYIIAGAIGMLGVLQGLNILVLPESTWLILSAFGLGFLRAGVNGVAKTIKETKR